MTFKKFETGDRVATSGPYFSTVGPGVHGTVIATHDLAPNMYCVWWDNGVKSWWRQENIMRLTALDLMVEAMRKHQAETG